MQGRRSVWSDERIIKLTAQFAPAADEVWRLQRDDDPECTWFRTAVRGKPDAISGTMQGTYVLTATGKLLARVNSANADHVLKVLHKSLEAWNELPASERKANRDAAPRANHRWEDSYPANGLVLERFARDISDNPSDQPIAPINRDPVWFSEEEAQGWLPEARVGASTEVATHCIERLARTSFVDNVRGQTLPFIQSELRNCAMRSEVLAIRGPHIDIRIQGHIRAVADGPWRGEDNYWKPARDWPRQLSTQIFGEATFDRDSGRFTAFELVATGKRQGRTAFNGRHREATDSSHSIGFLLRLAPPSYRIAPTFINMYDAPWVKMPKQKIQ